MNETPASDRPAAAVRAPSRRSARDRTDPAAARRQRWLVLATVAAIAALVVAYVVFVAGRPPDGPVRELAVFGAAVDERDLDRVLALWSRAPAEGEGDDPRVQVAQLFAAIGARGMTPGVEPPRVRRIDATTYRVIHRVGEADIESIWAFDGESFRITAVGLAR